MTTKKQLVARLISTESNTELVQDIELLVTTSKKYGYIVSPTLQSVAIKPEKESVLKNIAHLITWIHSIETKGWRTRKQTQILFENIFLSIDQNKPLTILAFLCPSYKKGRSAVGFNSEIGQTTKHGISNTISFYKQCLKSSIPARCTILFSDLVLENADLLGSKDTEELLNNIKSARDFTQKISPLADFLCLSEFPSMKNKIGMKGVTSQPDNVDKSTYELVLKRNTTFYKENFGWETERILERTNILAATYPIIGNFFRESFSPFVLLYTANSFERSKMYLGKDLDNPFPIIYPKKSVSRNLG